jgi:Chaperone for flagella basal body P-ring formation
MSVLILKKNLPIAISLAFAGSSTAYSLESVCVRTPAMAVRTIRSDVTASMLAQKDGYRVAKVHWDPLLNQRWAIIASCGHPDRPSIAMPLTDLAPQTEVSPLGNHVGSSPWMQSPFPIIHAGDLVQLQIQNNDIRIEVAGRAEENGAIGNKVRVRLLHTGFDTNQEQTLRGIVRGPGHVEIEP